jgi:glyoxylase-like metal-dependent hydrolase (beta-lactamase superfamily II)
MHHRPLFSAFQSLPLAAISWLIVLSLGARADDSRAIQHIQVGPAASQSRVPEVTVQGRQLAPQAVSALDTSADGQVITVGTMAFSHDANLWQFAPDGALLAKRSFPPWGPMQVATLAGRKAMAVGLAYSRVTSPDPTVWAGDAAKLMNEKLNDELAQSDSRDGQLSRLRPGEGDWRTGWFTSTLGELFVRGPDWIFQPPNLLIDANGRRSYLRYEDKNLLPTSRALRMAASLDGKRIAFGWLGFNRDVFDLPSHRDSLSVWQVQPNARLWSAAPDVEAPPPIPDTAADFTELASTFRLAADLMLPGHATSAVALNRDGSRVAAIEHGIWGWVRTRPAIGKWDPPIKVLNFLPKQHGKLRVFDDAGRQLADKPLPAEGLFEIAIGANSEDVWCWPASWFARGMAGQPWFPIDPHARTVYRIAMSEAPTVAFDFPDAIADFRLSPTDGRALVSCWDGSIYLLDRNGKLLAKHDAGGPARLVWSNDGAFAIVGNSIGRLLRIENDGAVTWSKAIPESAVPPPREVAEVVPGLPIYQGGRIPGSEHAYVGDIWIIKNGADAIFIDSGGVSGVSITRARLRALGINRVTHLLHTHTHGDHAGGAYLWRAAGAKTVGPKSAALPLTWLMPMLTDYGIYPPRPLDVPLPLTHARDETDIDVGGLKVRALFVPGHSFDATIYKLELAGKRIAFTGDLGFENQDILHRCWGDVEKARALVGTVRDKLLDWRPDVVFTGHGVRPEGTRFIEQLLNGTEESLKRRVASPQASPSPR